MAFEPSAVRFVVEHASTVAPAVLRQVVEEERQVIDDPKAFAYGLARFQRMLVELSGNKPLIHLWAAMHEVVERHQAMVISMKRRGGHEMAMMAAVTGLRSQERLIQLIERRDIDQAEAHWRRHLSRANRVWVSGFEDLRISELFKDS